MQRGNLPQRLPSNSTDFFNRVGVGGHAGQPGHPGPFPFPDSSSNTSSCNSSTPSSPAVMVISTPPHSASVLTTKFNFPDPIVVSQPDTSSQKPLSPNPVLDSVKSNDSDKTLSGTFYLVFSVAFLFEFWVDFVHNFARLLV